MSPLLQEPVRPPARRRRVYRRAAPALTGVAVAAFAGGLGLGSLHESGGERTVRIFLGAWERGDHEKMYGLLSGAARAGTPAGEFGLAYRRAAATATLVSARAVRLRPTGEGIEATMELRTRVFGRLRARLLVPLEGDRIAWGRQLVFPGLRRGERLSRTSDPPRRATILARDGAVIAEGPAGDRRVGLGAIGASIAGTLGPPVPLADRRALYAQGLPRDARTGQSGLERVLDHRLTGRPGGVLVAGRRVLAQSAPVAAAPVRTTIDPTVQAAAVEALQGRLGGVVALDALTAEVRALAGLAYSAPQPPGSTFKIITATAVLEARLARPSTRFPVETKAVIDGYELENANGESCGGTLLQSFAHSCNSVWAPLGVRVGARRLVRTARRYGFGAPPTFAGELPSTIPAAAEIGSSVALGSTAIGQGRVLATPLQLALVAHTVASGGVRHRPTLLAGAVRGRPVRVTTPPVARSLERMMVAVVRDGTGGRASLRPVRVAGKTGTAELEDTTDAEQPGEVDEPPGYDTDAWFTAYAPLRRPVLAVAVLLVRGGAGGDTAAPAARDVLRAGLRRR